jgi:hypothetical protein
LTEEEYKRLLPFFHRKSARQRLILYLIADGYNVADLVAMRTFALKQIKLPVEMRVYRDEVVAEFPYDMAFTYPNGKVKPHTSYYRLIRETAMKVLKRPMSQEQLRLYIQTGKK